MVDKICLGVSAPSLVRQHLRHGLLHLTLVALLLPGMARALDSDEQVAATQLTDRDKVVDRQEAPSNVATPPAVNQKALPANAEPTADILSNQNSQPSAPQDPSAVTPPTSPSNLSHDLSPWGMFMAADWVVKTVMIGLIIASGLTWAVFIAKSIELKAIQRLLKRDLGHLNKAQTLADTRHVSGIGREFVEAANAELHLSADLTDLAERNAGIKERIASHLSRIEATSARAMLFGIGLLATIGAISPFVGLFGTVWGIMNSFIGISQANTTNLAVVAPGIAEALLATALGLVAAIPAVVIYNHFTRQIAGAKTLLADSAAAVMRLVSRDLDRGSPVHPSTPHNEIVTQ